MTKKETLKLEIKNSISELLSDLEFKELIENVNDLREFIHQLSPFKNEPVDFVKWIINSNVISNDYNPNKVAPLANVIPFL